ncbi:MAG: F0F1 ATP synthase subunit B [Planctomycetota bacterium]|jgi:F-type H+-transporting ATPase subunit b|nr:F0F1 ATP synthase subunit B [Planctomycetota bacterium]
MDDKIPFLLNHADSFWYGLIAFVVFAFVIAKFGIKPIVTAIDARDQRIKDQLAEAERTANKAQELQAKLNTELAGAEARIAEMMNDARRDAEASKAKVLDAGRDEVEALRNKALREIEAARYQAVVAIRDEVAQIAADVAGKILATELDGAKHQQLVATAIDDYEAKAGV